MRRVVEPELLDHLPPADPRAIASRRDLQRLNRAMGHAGLVINTLRAYLGANSKRPQRLRVCELGAGDGTFLLELARRWASRGLRGTALAIDRQSVISTGTRCEFAALGWPVEPVETDVFCWLDGAAPESDVILCNLFLHHFQETEITRLMRLAGARTSVFIACEPSRSRLALKASQLVGLIGCNSVTRHDAVVSVRAGFDDQELSRLWSADGSWRLSERSAGLFSHCFFARRYE